VRSETDNAFYIFIAYNCSGRNGIYAASCADMRSRRFTLLSESVIYSFAFYDRYGYIREAKKARNGKFIILQVSIYKAIYKPYGRAFGVRRALLMRNACATLNLSPRDSRVSRNSLQSARTRRRDVTRSDSVGWLAGIPWQAVRGV